LSLQVWRRSGLERREARGDGIGFGHVVLQSIGVA
jgi:hypothetical protein